MAEAIGALRAELSATAAQFEKDMGRARAALGITKQSFDALKQGALLAGAAIAATVTAFAAIAKATANAGDQISKMSRQLGTSAEDLSALGHAADLANVPLEGLQTGMRTLAARMLDASQGLAEAQRTFAQLGVSVKQADGSLRPLQEVLLEVSDRFATMQDATARAALAQEVFGRQGLALIPLLESGSAAIREQMQEAKALGIVWSTDAAKAAEEFNDNLTRLGKAFDGMKLAIGQALIPILNDLAERLVTLAKSKEFREWVESLAAGLSQLAKALMDELPGALKIAFVALRAFGFAVLSVASGLVTIANAILAINLAVHQGGLGIRKFLGIEESLGVTTEEVEKKVASLTASIEKNRETIALLSRGMGALAFGEFPTLPERGEKPADFPAPGGPPSWQAGPTPDQIKAAEDLQKLVTQNYYESIKAQQAMMDEANEFGRKFLEEKAKLQQAAGDELLKIQERIDTGFIASWVARIEELKALDDKAAQDAAQQLQETAAQRIAAEKKLTDDLIKYWVDRIDAQKALDDKAAMDQVALLQAAAKERAAALDALRKSFIGVFDGIADGITTAIRGVQAGTQTMEQAFRKTGENIVLSIQDTIIRRGINAISEALANLAFGAPAAKGASSSGIGGGLIGGLFAGIGKLFGFAEGGIVPGPIGFPQLAVVHGGEQVIPANERGGGAATNVTQVFAPQVGIPEAIHREFWKLLPTFKREATAAILEARTKGGAMARAMGARQ